MKKGLILLLALICVGFLGGQAMAAPMLSDVLSGSGIDLGANDYSDSGAETVYLTDADGVNDDATAFLILEFAGWASSNTFGIYNPEATSEMLQVFSGSDSAIESVTLTFDIDAGTVTNNSTGDSADIGTEFGFYLNSPAPGIFYSEASLNQGNYDYALIYDTSDNQVGGLLGSDVVVAFEDLLGTDPNNDWDFDDMVVGISDVTPVPEPATVVISCLFLLGAGTFVRRKLHGTV